MKKSEVNEFLTRVILRLSNGKMIYLGKRTEKKKINVRKIAAFIRRHRDLLDEFLDLCIDEEDGRDFQRCRDNIDYYIRTWLLRLYKSRVEPVHTIVSIIIEKGYVAPEDLRQVTLLQGMQETP